MRARYMIAHVFKVSVRSMVRHLILGVMIASVWHTARADEQTAMSADHAIRGAMQHWLDAYNNKNIEALMSLYSDRIYYANNGSKLARDINAIRDNYARQFNSAPDVTIDFSEELVASGLQYAHIAGKYRVNIPEKDGTISHTYGRVLLIFERAGSEWKLVVDFDNTAPDIDGTFF